MDRWIFLTEQVPVWAEAMQVTLKVCFIWGGKGSCKVKAKPYNPWRYTFTIWRLALSPSLWRVWGLHKQVECSKNNSNDSLKIDFKKSHLIILTVNINSIKRWKLSLSFLHAKSSTVNKYLFIKITDKIAMEWENPTCPWRRLLKGKTHSCFLSFKGLEATEWLRWPLSSIPTCWCYRRNHIRGTF